MTNDDLNDMIASAAPYADDAFKTQCLAIFKALNERIETLKGELEQEKKFRAGIQKQLNELP